jgi:alpha-tubulin suppressor-like RCC1 family protein
VVLGDGRVYCWGRNESGQLGDGSTTTRLRATQVTGITDARQVAASEAHTCALRADGTVACWGSNAQARLGTPVSTTSSSTPVPDAGGITMAVELCAGDAFNCARIASGIVQCFGAGTFGRLGASCTAPGGICPTAINVHTGLLPAATMLDCGGPTGAARRASPTELRGWGYNDNAQLGYGGASSQTNPVLATTATETSILDTTALAVGQTFACIVRSDATVWCAGANNWGQLGLGTTGADVLRFGAVPGVTDAVNIEVGHDHACAVDAAGSLTCWGRNDQNQVGIGAGGSMMVTSPSAVTVLPTPVLRHSLGEQHTCAVLAAQNVVCWGNNTYGQLGNDSMASSATPVPVAGLPTP